MYNDAGVSIDAWKQLSPNMSDEEFGYIFNVAEALGCTHTTLELSTDAVQLKRIGDFAVKQKKNKWTMPASVELEYDIPEGSDAVREVRTCVDYCRRALGAPASSAAAR